ncbi:hypothetical protein KKF84_07150 [Myxococcota bacterium]|nr:hypothetical protein [Myxococcota bacterium]MBU1535079.1 hypothetical protein [Myxococcota bacterium]
MQICPSCGIIAATSLIQCQECGNPYPYSLPRALPLPSPYHWVFLRGHFVCGSCRFDIPLNFLDLDGTVRCNNCGIQQKFPLQTWQTALYKARGIIDFTGDERPPEDSPLWPFFYKELPENAKREAVHLGAHASLVHLISPKSADSSAVTLAVSTGNPLCESCIAPLQISKVDETSLQLACPACSHEQRYQRDENFSTIKGLAFAVANEHREGAMEAIISARSEGGVIALDCPKCGGALPPHKDQYFATCTYCGTSCYIDPALLNVKDLPDKPSPLWLLFQGSSAFKYDLALKAFEYEQATKPKKPPRKTQESPASTGSPLMEFITAHPYLLPALAVILAIAVVMSLT